MVYTYVEANGILNPGHGSALLERAINFALGTLALVTPEALRGSTPCAAWDLEALLGHLGDSLLALNEAAAMGCVLGVGEDDVLVDDPAALVRERACGVLGAWAVLGAGPRAVASGERLARGVSGGGRRCRHASGWGVRGGGRAGCA